MPNYFQQYSGIAGQAADAHSIPQPIFFGLIQTESSWNPFASPGTTSAFGFTQLTNGAAAQVGANKFNPTSNLYGGAAYLSSMPGSNWTEKLAHYYSGPGAGITQAGLGYANKVLNAAKNFMGGGSNSSSGMVSTAVNAGACAAGDPLACASAATGLGSMLGIGGGGDSCGLNPICYLKQWIDSSEFFPRLALAILAFILILGGLYLFKQSN